MTVTETSTQEISTQEYASRYAPIGDDEELLYSKTQQTCGCSCTLKSIGKAFAVFAVAGGAVIAVFFGSQLGLPHAVTHLSKGAKAGILVGATLADGALVYLFFFRRPEPVFTSKVLNDESMQ